VGGHVLDDEEGSRQVGGQLANQLVECFSPPADVPSTIMFRPFGGIPLRCLSRTLDGRGRRN
jgi:hypothetical protein